MELRNKHIVVAVTGGIAAYKSAELIRELQRMGAQVRVAMTECAADFVTARTFQALSGFPVHLNDNGQLDSAGMDHIALARWSDLIIVAPASANTIAKLSHGIADNFVSTLCLAHEGPLAVAPAMNQAMWCHEATQDNVNTLIQRGVHIFGPAEGLQACGESGQGRLLEPHELAKHCYSVFSNHLLNEKNIVITAGPTIEPIDPVRFISNRSSGKMGYALADAANEAGANVTVVTGPTHLPKHPQINYLQVESASEMFLTTMKEITNADLFIAAAAVADYAPTRIAEHKIKKTENTLSIELEKTKDILKEAKLSRPDLTCVGFAAETENLIQNAELKLKNKSLDMVIANQVGIEDQGFDSDYNSVDIIWNNGKQSISKTTKAKLAVKIIQLIANELIETNVTYIQSNKY